MNKLLPLHLQEIIFSSSDPSLSRQISQLVNAGKLRKLIPKVYSANLEESPETLIKRNIFTIIGHLFPGILLSHRSALEFKPTATGQLFLTYPYKRKLELPGLTLNIMQGHDALDGDNLLTEGLYVSQQARAMLENLEESRKPGPYSKTITVPELEERLEQIIRVKGEDSLNELRDRAREISGKLGMEKQFSILNKLVGALLATQSGKDLSSPVAVARALGQPYDPARITLFERLFIELKQQEFKAYPEENNSPFMFRNFAFFEAYFSNYIEGTEFEVSEAKEIIENNLPLPRRDEDSHDILGTYKLLSNKTEMSIVPDTPENFLNIMRYRHAVLLSARLSKKPGEFKGQNNRAGNTQFVDYQLVNGTLTKGFEYYRNLTDAFAKAAFMMFLVSEVHPFLDGNGRLARVMMNAELVSAGQTRIIIPTVYREDYLGAIRQLSRQHRPEAYIRMLGAAQYFSSTITGNNMDELQSRLEASNAFMEPEQGKLQIIPTRLPSHSPDEGQAPSAGYTR